MFILFQPPCCVQGCQPAGQAAQGWGIHNLLGQPVPVRHHPLGEILPPNIQPKPPLSKFKPFPLVLSLSIHVSSHTPSCLYDPFKYWKATTRSPLITMITMITLKSFGLFHYLNLLCNQKVTEYHELQLCLSPNSL